MSQQLKQRRPAPAGHPTSPSAKEQSSNTLLTILRSIPLLGPLVKYIQDNKTVQQAYHTFMALNHVTVFFIFSAPILGLIGVFTTPLCWKTYLFAFIKYWVAGLGITAGYHRLYSHRSYKANRFVKYLLVLMGTVAFEGSVLDWCDDHRKHHRYTDTDKDPYNALNGFWYSHMGWMIWKRPADYQGADIRDLKADPVLVFQDKYYPFLAAFMGLLLPAIICHYLWNNFWGGLLIAGFLSATMILQCTFFINSLAHYWGADTFTDEKTSRDSYLVALVTFGEGYHNFHHEFPYDYRNGVEAWHFDPGKWLINLFAAFGGAFDLGRMPCEVVEKNKIQMMEKKLQALKATQNWGPVVSDLPEMSKSQFDEHIQQHAKLLIIEGVVYDITDFSHPGGDIINAYIGKDATKEFTETVYKHSMAARNILHPLAVARYTQ